LDENNAWIYPHLHSAARRMTEVARAHASADCALTDRVLKQLARELLLAQGSDWPFLMKTGTAKHYATKRVTDHLLRFNRLHDEFTSGRLDEGFLSNCEWRDNLFPDVNWRYYV
jgi:1,4-alpha-glucan branching enzyme